ncbi:MAG: hypothetical protein NTZ52_04885 [Chlamydiae bacterium]|nr:hypothetical protein [Chlamydiota bacterium]
MSELKPEDVTKKQLSHDPALCFTEAMLSYYLLHHRRNDLDRAVRKIGRKLVIRKDLFLEWIENQSKGGHRG